MWARIKMIDIQSIMSIRHVHLLHLIKIMHPLFAERPCPVPPSLIGAMPGPVSLSNRPVQSTPRLPNPTTILYSQLIECQVLPSPQVMAVPLITLIRRVTDAKCVECEAMLVTSGKSCIWYRNIWRPNPIFMVVWVGASSLEHVLNAVTLIAWPHSVFSEDVWLRADPISSNDMGTIRVYHIEPDC